MNEYTADMYDRLSEAERLLREFARQHPHRHGIDSVLPKCPRCRFRLEVRAFLKATAAEPDWI